MESVVKAFWAGKRVFITGHTGFKGSWLSLWLQTLGADLMGYALEPSTTPNLFHAAQVASGMQSIRGDILDLSAMQKAMQDFAPQVVLHLAAQPIVRLSYQDPVGTFQTNVIGTVNLLECVRQCPSVRSVVIVTSDKCYENREWNWPYRETDTLGGHDPYSASKACAELVTNCYRTAFLPPQQGSQPGPALASARAGNVIGGGDWAKDRLIPDILRAFSSGRTAHIRRPQALRPWQHVLEPLRGYLLLAQGLFEQGSKLSGAWNFGPRHDDAKSVEWIVGWLARAWGEGAAWDIDAAQHPHEAGILKLDWSKAEAHLGWRPRMRLEDALTLTVSWHRRVLAKQDARTECLEQIAAYMNRPDPA